MISVVLKKGREKNVSRGNPWVFSGSIDRVIGTAQPGDMCNVRDAAGHLVGVGYFNRNSSITVRMLDWGTGIFGSATLRERIGRAVARRGPLLDHDTDSCRLINSEGDFLPGLIVDKCAEGLVVQILTAGMERMRQEVMGALLELCSPRFIYERSDTESRKREGLAESEGVRHGSPPGRIIVKENGLSFYADIAQGQKTGFFFDQRANRLLLGSHAAGKRVCDCFCYSGAFTVYALAGGALHVDSVDISGSALGLLGENAAINGCDSGRVTLHTADVFTYLRETGPGHDCIILDPPKFARHPGEVERASRGYKDINLLACRNVAPGGVIFTFSCSHAIDIKLFRQIVFAAASDSGRRFQLLHTLSAGPDHPVNIAHREGEYLKGLVLRESG